VPFSGWLSTLFPLGIGDGSCTCASGRVRARGSSRAAWVAGARADLRHVGWNARFWGVVKR